MVGISSNLPSDENIIASVERYGVKYKSCNSRYPHHGREHSDDVI
jgi:hypothetical protein